MTFGSTFGRTFSPTFQPKSQAAVAGGWWLSGGIAAANCMAAYQPKGAASLTASYANLANVGTYTASQGSGTITWDVAEGWIIDAAGDRIDTGIPISGADYTVYALVNTLSRGINTDYGRLFEVDSDGKFFLCPMTDVGSFYTNGGSYYEKVYNKTTFIGTIGFAGLKPYKNGSYIGTDIPSGTGQDGSLYIGNRAGNDRTFNGYIRAFAVYNAVLTTAQISALHTAMAAL